MIKNTVKMLSEQTADNILAMITEEKRFATGDKLPNENILAQELGVSRTTLREAVRILMAHNVLEIRRGNGTYVCEIGDLDVDFSLNTLTTAKVQIRDLLEMRLIFEPEMAYLAAQRATDKEMEKILYYGHLDEEMFADWESVAAHEQMFHNTISKATHNDFMRQLMPIINKAVHQVISLSKENPVLSAHTIQDHRSIMEFLQRRNADGARTAMRMHILHIIQGLEVTQHQ